MSLMLLHAEDAGWYVLVFVLPLILVAGVMLRRQKRS